MLYVGSRETGDVTERVNTLEEGLNLIEEYEEQDKKDGVYEKGFYTVMNKDRESYEGISYRICNYTGYVVDFTNDLADAINRCIELNDKGDDIYFILDKNNKDVEY